MTQLQTQIVAPGGNAEKVKIAYACGADSVYVGGKRFSLRKSADNFSIPQLQRIVDYAKSLGKKLYVTLNIFPHQSDMTDLPVYLEELEKIQPHALIISDMGTFQAARKYTTIPIHMSTQASISNWRTAALWKKLGASRAVLARELSLEECRVLKQKANIEIETFIHGAMCSSYSGKCVISNYTAGRDSNRGGCVQSCRHLYQLFEPNKTETDISKYIMNAKDLMLAKQIPQMIEAGIDAFKIEGRMKSNLYVANTVAIYRDIIDQYLGLSTKGKPPAINQLSDVSNRTFSDHHEMKVNQNIYQKSVDFMGTIKYQDADGWCYIDMKAPLTVGQTFYIQNTKGKRITLSPTHVTNNENEPIQLSKPNGIIKFQVPEQIEPLSLLLQPTPE